MKKILFLLFAASTLMAAAQNKSTVETRALVHNLNQAKRVDNMSKNLLQRYPVININNKSEYFAWWSLPSHKDGKIYCYKRKSKNRI